FFEGSLREGRQDAWRLSVWTPSAFLFGRLAPFSPERRSASWRLSARKAARRSDAFRLGMAAGVLAAFRSGIRYVVRMPRAAKNGLPFLSFPSGTLGSSPRSASAANAARTRA